MAGRFEFRPEFRMDFSDPAQFGDMGSKKSQATLTFAFLGWF